MKCAVIDIGSNSVRLLFQSGGKTLYKALNTTRLGEGLAVSGKLSLPAMQRSALAVQEFKQRATSDGATQVYVFATAAVRSAENGGEFVMMVEKLAGLKVDVISGEEEAAIGLLGALGRNDGGIIDIGGGSTELTLRQNFSVTYSKSLNVGAVRLYDLCGRNRQKLQLLISEKISEYGKVECSNLPVYGIGGTATSLAALALGLKNYDGQKVQDFILTKSALDELTDKLFKILPEELVNTSCLPFKRAEIIAGGALLLSSLMQYLDLNSITISEKDNLEGYLLKRLSE